MKEKILEQKGKWLITYKDNLKIVIDLDNMLFDSYEWYKLNQLNSELEKDMLDNLLKNAKEIRREKYENSN